MGTPAYRQERFEHHHLHWGRLLAFGLNAMVWILAIGVVVEIARH